MTYQEILELVPENFIKTDDQHVVIELLELTYIAGIESVTVDADGEDYSAGDVLYTLHKNKKKLIEDVKNLK